MQRDAKFRKNINSDKWEVERIWAGGWEGKHDQKLYQKIYRFFFYIGIINKIAAWFLSRKAKDKLR